jgi:hypothetical protein
MVCNDPTLTAIPSGMNGPSFSTFSIPLYVILYNKNAVLWIRTFLMRFRNLFANSKCTSGVTHYKRFAIVSSVVDPDPIGSA